jgi:nicotinamidase-related amidase
MADTSLFEIKAGESVIALVDLQERLLAAMPDPEGLTRTIRLLIEGTRPLEVPVVWSEQYPKGLGPTAESVRALLPKAARAEKMTFSAWREPSFADRLKATGRTTVILPGIETHVCVMQTALDLLYAGYRVFVPADGVASRTEENRRIGLATMERAGAVITSMEAVVFQLLERAGTDAFKAFSKMIR